MSGVSPAYFQDSMIFNLLYKQMGNHDVAKTSTDLQISAGPSFWNTRSNGIYDRPQSCLDDRVTLRDRVSGCFEYRKV